MLPFLKPDKIAGAVLIAKRKKDGSIESSNQEVGEHGPELMSAAEDLLRALASKDARAVASALQAAYNICGSAPSEDENV